jgi:hypothetical protein
MLLYIAADSQQFSKQSSVNFDGISQAKHERAPRFFSHQSENPQSLRLLRLKNRSRSRTTDCAIIKMSDEKGDRLEAVLAESVLALNAESKEFTLPCDAFSGVESKAPQDREAAYTKFLDAFLAVESPLVKISFCNCALRDDFLNRFVESGLKKGKFPTLEVLNIEGNLFTSDGVIAFAEYIGSEECITNRPALKEFRLTNQAAELTVRAQDAVAAAPDQNQNIVKVGCNFANANARNKANRATSRNGEIARKKRAAKAK